MGRGRVGRAVGGEDSAGEGSVRATLSEGEDARERLFRLGAEALTGPGLLGLVGGGGGGGGEARGAGRSGWGGQPPPAPELLGLLWGASARMRALAEAL